MVGKSPLLSLGARKLPLLFPGLVFVQQGNDALHHNLSLGLLFPENRLLEGRENPNENEANEGQNHQKKFSQDFGSKGGMGELHHLFLLT
jgi:hypothetical protein